MARHAVCDEQAFNVVNRLEKTAAQQSTSPSDEETGVENTETCVKKR
jgi:hypothetical protein